MKIYSFKKLIEQLEDLRGGEDPLPYLYINGEDLQKIIDRSEVEKE